MSGSNTNNGRLAWVKWPAIFALSFLWLCGAATSFLLGGLGKGGNALAAWSLRQIEGL